MQEGRGAGVMASSGDKVKGKGEMGEMRSGSSGDKGKGLGFSFVRR